jgi:hypothetical protein
MATPALLIGAQYSHLPQNSWDTVGALCCRHPLTHLEDGTPIKRRTFLSARAHAQIVRKVHGNIALSARLFCHQILLFQGSVGQGAVLHIADGGGKMRPTPSSSIFLCRSVTAFFRLHKFDRLRIILPPLTFDWSSNVTSSSESINPLLWNRSYKISPLNRNN